MCGFGGILNSTRMIGAEELASVAAAVRHRGPDHTGIVVLDDGLRPAASGRHGLFFNRLSILDLHARANQPFADDRYTLVYNGEIYNFKDLRTRLESAGIRFTTTSDTEVLFHCLRYWGRQVLPELNGMFAFFFLDRSTGNFLLARDRLGIKPLYMFRTSESLAFASELDSVLSLTGIQPEQDVQAIQMYLWLQYVPSPFTGIKGVEKLPPGHSAEGSIAGLAEGVPLAKTCWWDAYDQVGRTPASEGDPLEMALVRSLKGQLEADVPVGIFLSSGVDSSLLAAILQSHGVAEREVRCFSVSFREQADEDESYAAARFLRGFRNPGLVHTTLTIDPLSVAEGLDTMYTVYDEPFGDPAALLNMAISRHAREHVTVALSGDGGDELFWGYPRYGMWRDLLGRTGVAHGVPAFLKQQVGTLASAQWRHRLLTWTLKDPLDLALYLLNPWPYGLLPDPRAMPRQWALEGVERVIHRDDFVSVFDLKTYLPDAMLYKVDRSSMAAGLEVRVPYLDNGVVEHALALSLKEKSNVEFRRKAPLLRLLRRLAPQYDLQRPKQGFALPLAVWMRGPWKERLLSTLSDDALVDVGCDPRLFSPFVRELYRDRGEDTSTAVWRLFSLVLWRKRWQYYRSGTDR